MRDTLTKLTRQDRTTYGGFQYEPRREYRFSGEGELCGPGFSHLYLSPETAVLHNPIHAAFPQPLGWRVEADIAKYDGEMKVGATRIILLETIALPAPTPEQRVAYAIRCAWPHGTDEWRSWARSWLEGGDRSKEAARAAWAAAWAVAARAAWAAAAEEAAWAAAWAVEAAKEGAPLTMYASWACSTQGVFYWNGMGEK